MRWSDVKSLRPWERAVATITQSPGSRKAPASAAASCATSVMIGRTQQNGLLAELIQQLTHALHEPATTLSGEGDFHQAHGADAQRRLVPDGSFQHAHLFSG